MGCTSSKPEPPRQIIRPQAAPAPAPRGKTPREVLYEQQEREREQAERERELLANKILSDEKKNLQAKTLPLLQRRFSVDHIDDNDTEKRELVSTNTERNQKKMRRKYAKLSAEKSQRWMLLSYFTDVFEEEEMKELSDFFSLAVKYVPDILENDIQHLNVSQNQDLKMISQKALNKEDLEEDSPALRSKSGSLRLAQIEIGNISRDISTDQKVESVLKSNVDSSYVEYDLPSGPITLAVAQSIISHYKSGDRLSIKAVQKLLRLAYRSLSKLPNTTRITLSSKEHVTVVGDIHGQLPDLLHILDESGLPSSTHKYIFNGDFVDRGDQGIECLCVLLSLYLAFPQHVAFNRGNHEDFAICSCYGFQQECQQKYDDVTFGMCVEVFNYIPLYAIINSSVIVLHGGLFHSLDVTLPELDAFERHDYSLLDMTNSSSELESLDPIPRSDRVGFYKQIQRDTLWSDPKDSMGKDHNNRGAGIAFGPDITQSFLDRNKLKMLIRSHECVRGGFDLPFRAFPQYEYSLCTVFSASNYGGAGNTAAFMEICKNDHIRLRSASLVQPINGTDLVYDVHYFHIDSEGVADDANTVVDFQELASKSAALNPTETSSTVSSNPPSSPAVSRYDDEASSPSIPEMIFRKKLVLSDAFQTIDTNSNGIIPVSKWSDVMQHSLKLRLRWASLLPALMRKPLSECISTDPKGVEVINYQEFLNSFNSPRASQPHASFSSPGTDEEYNAAIVQALYPHSKLLESIFQYFNTNEQGFITYGKFIEQCEKIKQKVSNGKSPDFPLVYQLMDVKGSNEVDINLFFEMYRLADNFVDISSQIDAKNEFSMRKVQSGVNISLNFSDMMVPAEAAPSLQSLNDISSSFKAPPNDSTDSPKPDSHHRQGRRASTETVELNGIRINID